MVGNIAAGSRYGDRKELRIYIWIGRQKTEERERERRGAERETDLATPTRP